ncbi:MAG: alpha/beta fold hydrolase [Sphingomonadaceae bacterium]|nr:alpha/beta fold hydrolase [Sphingomonadaceae bacterium]
MKLPRALLCLALACAVPATAEAARPRADPAYARALAAVTRDPPRDAQHPARNRQLVIDSHGAQMNALFFQAAGAGPHPTMLLLHGLPGNERNLDLAQAVRRAGWNVLTFTYRGAWGSGGDFSLANAIEDTHAALAFLRSRGAIRDYGVDERRLVVAGHSMGGYMAAQEAAGDATDPRMPARRVHPPLAGLVLLDAWNIAGDAAQVRAAGAAGRARLVAGLDDFGHSLHGATPESVADEVIADGPGWSLPALAPRLRWTPVLTLTALHGGAEGNRATTAALRRAGAQVTARELDSDHPFADHRIALAAEVVRWLRGIEASR